MKESDIFIEVDCFQKNKAGNIVCGDSYMSQKLKEEDRIISVLSDGLGSGIKASVLSAMTATMAMNYTAMNESILQTALSIIHTLPKDMVRKISYSTFCIFDIDCFGNTRIVEYESPAVYLFRRGQAVEIRKKKIPIEREDLENTYLWISEFKLEKEDRLICRRMLTDRLKEMYGKELADKYPRRRPHCWFRRCFQDREVIFGL